MTTRQTDERQRSDSDEHFAYGQKSMEWYGFGSPTGLGILLVCAGVCAVLMRLAVFGL